MHLRIYEILLQNSCLLVGICYLYKSLSETRKQGPRNIIKYDEMWKTPVSYLMLLNYQREYINQRDVLCVVQKGVSWQAKMCLQHYWYSFKVKQNSDPLGNYIPRAPYEYKSPESTILLRNSNFYFIKEKNIVVILRGYQQTIKFLICRAKNCFLKICTCTCMYVCVLHRKISLYFHEFRGLQARGIERILVANDLLWMFS